MATLRDRQRKVTVDNILTALADHVAEAGNFDFAVADIADRAGVSHRTVYNHFSTRQALIEALSSWAEEEMRQLGSPDATVVELSDLPNEVLPSFLIFEQMPGISEALARVDAVTNPTQERTQRTEDFVVVMGHEFPDLDPRQARVAAMAIRNQASVKMWYALTREQGLGVEEAAEVVAWTIQKILDALRRGDHPMMETQT